MIYVTSNRTEPYWTAVREQTRRSEWLRDKLELWRCRYPDLDDTYDAALFSYSVYTFALYPKGYFANIDSPLSGSIRVEDWRAYGEEVKQTTSRLLTTLPSHYDLLTNIRASATLPADALPKQPARIGRV